MSNAEDVIIACPHCKVCSLKLSADEAAAVETGQLMFDVCSVCDNVVILNG
jgi:uncharacterized protein YbaR (Trm112 family)